MPRSIEMLTFEASFISGSDDRSDDRVVIPSTGRSSFAGPATPSSNSVGVSQGSCLRLCRGPLRRSSRTLCPPEHVVGVSGRLLGGRRPRQHACDLGRTLTTIQAV